MCWPSQEFRRQAHDRPPVRTRKATHRDGHRHLGERVALTASGIARPLHHRVTGGTVEALGSGGVRKGVGQVTMLQTGHCEWVVAVDLEAVCFWRQGGLL